MEYPSSPAHFCCHKINDGDDGLELWPRAKLLRWLDKAAIIEFESTLGQDEQEKAGRLCTVTEVQQTKYILKMVPMWSSFLVFGLVLSAGNTFFVEQADDLKSQDLLIYLVLLQSITSEMVSTLSPCLLSKWFPHVTKLNRIMMRIFGGMLMSMLCSAVACLVEGHRLDIAANNRASRHIYQIIPMSIWWLAPQFFLLGVMDGLATDGLEDFTTDDDHLSESMKKLLSAINTFVVTGIGSALNILSVYPNTKLFRRILNLSRLDLYFKYLTLYGTTLNCVYLLMISIFIYKGSDAAQVNEASMVIEVVTQHK
ncbi:hypothetical protein EZV62_025185 [Acer yangbiense]|uniref:Uncharacterized protein n=1 Tax=Acer yangbiense TaxID=1000413 RepID=A0A5C7GX72_9ROSI|nr:hypothetical protein EZV62_025185 [Acer yangbiense]